MTGQRANKARKTPRQTRQLSLVVGVLVSATLGDLAHAVVLGDVHVRSSLGQPLVAEVELLDADQDSLKARLASPSAHQRHSFQTPSQLGNVSVRVVQKRNGQRVLRVTSDRVVNEPTIEMLIEAEDRNGNLVRYMPLLIDPAPVGQAQPQFASRPEREQPPETVKQAVTERPRRASRRQDSAPAARDEQLAAATMRDEPRAKATAPKRNEPRVTPPLPEPRQTSAPAPSKVMAGDDSASRNTALIQPPASVLAQQRGPLAPLSTPATVATASPPSTTATPPSSQLPAPAPKLDVAPPADQTPATSMTSASASLGAAPEIVATAPAAPASQTVASVASAPAVVAESGRDPQVASPVPSNGWASTDYVLAGAGIAAVGGLALLAVRRRRRSPLPSLDVPSAHSGGPMIFGSDGRSSSRIGASSKLRNTRQASGLNTNVFSPSAFHMMEEVDPIAEADVYIAYGRVDHAKAILEDALRIHPERAALQLKLLSIHFDQRDTLSFNERARTVLSITGGRGPEWQEVRAMGRRLDPSNALYVAAQPPLGGVAEAPPDNAVDLDVTKPVEPLARPTAQMSTPSSPTGAAATAKPGVTPVPLAAPAFGKPAAVDPFWKSTWAPSGGGSAVEPSAPRPLFSDSSRMEFTISVTPDDMGTPSGVPDVAVSEVDLPLNFDDFPTSSPPVLDFATPEPAPAQTQAPAPLKTIDLELLDLADAPVRHGPGQLNADTAWDMARPAPAAPVSAPAPLPTPWVATEPPPPRTVVQAPKPAPKAAPAHVRPTAPASAPVVPAMPKARSQAANATRFDTLPAKLTLLQDLTRRGQRQEAAKVAQDVADLIAQLRLEASSIVSAVSRRA